ncbi:MAG: VWA domain-containing protein [Sedimentisphaerales bacterium]|nr:VWA domain-containing protein [Sedimentisphaerales bacterium]
MSDTYGFYLGQPWWLAVGLLAIPMIWLARRNLAALGRGRRLAAIVLRVVVLLLSAVLLARPMLVRQSHRATVIAVVDRSRSIPADLGEAALDYLSKAVTSKTPEDQLAIVDVAEAASISKLPSGDETVRRRNTTLSGQQTALSRGIEMAMAIASPDTATRIVLVSEGNETEGDLKEAAKTAAANKIPIDVLPVRYRYEREVLFKRVAAPSRARSGQTISLRFLLDSTADINGKLLLTLNDQPVDLVPDSPEVAVPVELKAGGNVKTISVPVGTRGIHKFEALFVPDDSRQDRIVENNRATAMTYVAGPGHVLVVDEDGAPSQMLIEALRTTNMEIRYQPAGSFPDNLALLMDTDAIVLADTSAGNFTYEQQEMLCRYVNDLGGGLVMVGGPNAFGAGGWIGSPVADILPVDLDPPQKKQLPKGALVLVMHACEMPQGNFWGKKVAASAVGALSRLDLVGILAYDWHNTDNWVFDLGPVGDKKAVLSAIDQMQMGDMPSLDAIVQEAYNKLIACNAAQKHIIVISDGDPAPPTRQLVTLLVNAQITCTGVCIWPHMANGGATLQNLAMDTQGRYYEVKDAMALPQIFIKEAQVVRRSMIIEQTFDPQVVYSLSETVKGIGPSLPALDGYVLTGPKGGLNQLVMTSQEADPILATCQSGLGRCVAFTSSADSRWAGPWMQWADFARFWEQVVRWAGRPAQAADCEIFADVQGQDVTVNVEASDATGKSIQFAGIEGQVLTPEMKADPLQLTQTGPGQYAGRFRADASGSYIVNIQYRPVGSDEGNRLANTIVTIPFAPEFRDLTDNAPLLEEVSRITGGRILPADPNQADLYDYAGLHFPQTHLPLLRPLMLIWLALFLLDIAVRRVILDVRAGWRRVESWVFATARREQSETISRLQATRQKLRAQWSTRADRTVIAKRYEGGEKYQGQVLGAEPQHKAEPPKPAETKKPEKKKEEAREASHIDQLLKAKRKATEDKGRGE